MFCYVFCVSCEGLLGQQIAAGSAHQPGEFPKEYSTRYHEPVVEQRCRVLLGPGVAVRSDKPSGFLLHASGSGVMSVRTG